MKHNMIIKFNTLKKGVATAYFLYLLGGIIGLHRVYTGEYIGACVYVILFMVTLFINPSAIIFSLLFLLVDLVVLQAIVDQYNKELYRNICNEDLIVKN